MWDNFEQILREIGQTDERLVGVLKTIYEEMRISNNRERDYNENLGRIIKNGIKRYGRPINLYPSDKKGRCQEICVSLALNKWNSRSTKNPGFKTVIKWLSNYWLKCNDVNKTTLIITTAWDEKDFSNTMTLKDRVDSYSANSDKNIIILLITSESISIQYKK